MPRGRPVKSAIRQRIVEILAVVNKAHGYEVAKIYRELYPKATMRVIYYHLRKGAQIGEFTVESIVDEKGTYSWGSTAEKVYYTLGPQAQPKGDTKLKAYVEKRGKRDHARPTA